MTTTRQSSPGMGPYTPGCYDAKVGKWAWVTPSVWARCVGVRYSPTADWVEFDWAGHENPDGSPFVGIQGRLF